MVPDGWRTVSLGETGDWLSGGTPSKRKPEFWSGGIPWVSPKDMKVLRIGSAIDEVSEAAIGNGTRLVEPGTLLLVVRGMILAHSFPVALTTRNVAFNQDIKAIVPTPNVDPEFLLNWLEVAKSDVLALVNEATHGTKRVPTEGLQAMPVHLPPLPEQRKIAAILGSVDALIERTQAVIDQVEVVKKGLMQELLTRGLPGRHTRFKQTEIGEIPESWEVRPVEMSGGVTAGKAKNTKLDAPMRPYLRTKNVYDGRIDLDDVLEMPFTDEEFARYRLRFGDILLNEGQSLELVGRCSMYRNEYQGDCAIQNQLVRFRANKETCPDFAEQLFRWCQSAGRFMEIATQTTSIAHLGVRRFAELLLPWPTLDEQREIASILQLCDARMSAESEKVRGLAWAKDALSSVLLSGEVRVQVDDAEVAA